MGGAAEAGARAAWPAGAQGTGQPATSSERDSRGRPAHKEQLYLEQPAPGVLQ
jgi:hypothetical protein